MLIKSDMLEITKASQTNDNEDLYANLLCFFFFFLFSVDNGSAYI